MSGPVFVPAEGRVYCQQHHEQLRVLVRMTEPAAAALRGAVQEAIASTSVQARFAQDGPAYMALLVFPGDFNDPSQRFQIHVLLEAVRLDVLAALRAAGLRSGSLPSWYGHRYHEFEHDRRAHHDRLRVFGPRPRP